jgi:WD40 repeat protein
MKPIRRQAPTISVTSAAFSPDSQILVIGYTPGGFLVNPIRHLQMWACRVGTGEKLWLAGGTERLAVVGFLPGGEEFLVRVCPKDVFEGALQVRSVRTGKFVRRMASHGKPIVAAGLSPDGKALVTADDEGGVKVWSTPGGKDLGEFLTPGGDAVPERISVSADGARALLAWDCRNRVGPAGLLYDLKSGKLLAEWYRHDGWLYGGCLSWDGRTVAVGKQLGRTAEWKETCAVVLWDAAPNRPRGQLTGVDLPISFVPNGESLLCLRPEVELCLRDAKTGAERWRVPGRNWNVHVVVSPDGRQVFRALGLYSPDSGAQIDLEVFEVGNGRLILAVDNREARSPFTDEVGF